MSKYKQRSHEAYIRHLTFLEKEKGDIENVLIGTSMFERMEWEDGAKSKFQEHLSDKSIWNLGCGGDKISNILYRLEDGKILEILKSRNVKRVIFMAGANDMEFGNPNTASTEKDRGKLKDLSNLYHMCLSLILQYLQDVNVVTIGIYPRMSDKYSHETMLRRVKEFNEMNSFNYYFGDALLKDDKCNKDMYFDNVHLNEKGYDVLCNGLKLIMDA